jgi:hypothetical protein
LNIWFLLHGHETGQQPVRPRAEIGQLCRIFQRFATPTKKGSPVGLPLCDKV